MPLTLFNNTNEMIRSFKSKENIHNKKHLLKRKLSKVNWFGARTQNNWAQVWNNLNGGNCWRKVKKHYKN